MVEGAAVDNFAVLATISDGELLIGAWEIPPLMLPLTSIAYGSGYIHEGSIQATISSGTFV